MPTIKNYFDTDFNTTFSLHKQLGIRVEGKEEIIGQITVRLHVDFISNCLFISYFIPACDIGGKALCDFILNPRHALELRNSLQMQAGLPYEQPLHLDEMVFSNLIYVYSENDFDASCKEYLEKNAKEKKLIIKIRASLYTSERTKSDKPLAFISHDSRDKGTIARPLSERLRKRMCTVWYDEYSLRVGDNLRENIEKGIKECHKCILILSPNFLTNPGWTKKEFESIFQRELIEKNNLILPIWHGVSREEVYNYCPSLSNTVAVLSSEGLDSVENKIYLALKN